MADLWGALPIPNVAPEEGQAAGDPLLTYLLSYLFAFLVEDDNGEAAWTALGVAPGYPFMQRALPFDPRRRGFNEKDLPSLYGWRSEMQPPEQIADSIRTRVSTISLLWVFPFAPQAHQIGRDPIVNAIHASIDLAIERGRTPSWRVPSDTDPIAATEGSLVWHYLSVAHIRAGAARPASLDIAMDDKAKPSKSYPAVEMSITVEEVLTLDLTRFDALAGLDLKRENDAADLLSEDLVPV